jgi:hypothetical protein
VVYFAQLSGQRNVPRYSNAGLEIGYKRKQVLLLGIRPLPDHFTEIRFESGDEVGGSDGE